MNNDTSQDLLNRIRVGSLHARYVFDEPGSKGYVYGYTGMGETMGCRLDTDEVQALRRLLADGCCQLGKDIDFVTADMRNKGFDPESGRKCHYPLRVRGRAVEAA